MARRSVYSLLAVLLVAGACSSAGADESDTSTTIAAIETGAPLATVNGAAIPVIEITELHVEFGALTSEEIAGSVLLLVLDELLATEAEAQFGVAASSDDVASAVEERTERFGSTERRDELLASSNRTPARFQLQSELDALRSVLARHLVTSGAEGFDLDLAYANYLLTDATVCVRHIQVISEEGFALVQRRLEAGEDFGTVALENSLDPLVDRTDGGSGAGGDLGCRTPASTPFPEAALDAAVGELVGPVFSAVGTHLIQVYERTAPNLEDVRDDVLEVGIATQGDGLFNTWATDVLLAADVTIDEAFGSWGPLPGTDGVPTVIPAG